MERETWMKNRGATLVLNAFHQNENEDGSFQNQHPYSKDELY